MRLPIPILWFSSWFQYSFLPSFISAFSASSTSPPKYRAPTSQFVLAQSVCRRAAGDWGPSADFGAVPLAGTSEVKAAEGDGICWIATPADGGVPRFLLRTRFGLEEITTQSG
jgi:hypothetical protein